MYSFLDEAAQWNRRKENIAQKINRSGLPLVLFGKASAVNRAFFSQIQVPLHFICDNNPEKWGSVLWGLEVIGPDQLQQHYTAYNVLILVPFEHQIVPQLQQLPIPPNEIFRLDLYFEEEDSADFFQTAGQRIKQIGGCLNDQLSQDTYEAVIRYRINRDPEFLSQVALPRSAQYFPDTLDGTPFLHSNEIFVDAGAFTGDSAMQFCRTVQGQYQAIYAFEPDRENYNALLENTKGMPNVFCTQSAVSTRRETLHFSSEDSSSRTDASGTQIVSADSLDCLLEGVPVTYLKMDVEGMECPALQGAQKVIQTYRPKLAICTYHSNSDMIRVPELILELNPEYKLYFRHYSNALVETVCYAI